MPAMPVPLLQSLPETLLRKVATLRLSRKQQDSNARGNGTTAAILVMRLAFG